MSGIQQRRHPYPTVVKKTIVKNYEQVYTSKLDFLDEVDKLIFFER